MAVEDANDPGTVGYYEAEIVSATDYYPFGMPMPGRTYQQGAYSYGFGGQEMDDEIAGVGMSYTAEFWQYDSRLGRRWNVDPIDKPWESGYATFYNDPVRYNDPLGLDAQDGDLDDTRSVPGQDNQIYCEYCFENEGSSVPDFMRGGFIREQAQFSRQMRLQQWARNKMDEWQREIETEIQSERSIVDDTIEVTSKFLELTLHARGE